MNSNPKISVIIPVFNGEKYIEETLRSVIDQTYGPVEIIVVNDGSTDHSEKIVDEYVEKYGNIILLNKPNTGVSDSRNYGFQHSTGELIIFLDADDLLLPNYLKVLVAKFSTLPNAGALYCDLEVIDENNVVISFIRANRIPNAYKILEWKEGFVVTPSCALIKRSSIESIGGWDRSLSTAADQDFFLRLSCHSPIEAIPIVLGRYRMHSSNMHSNIPLMEKDHISVYIKAKELNLFKNSLHRRRCMANLYFILAGSWIRDGQNKSRGSLFLLRSFLQSPLQFLTLMNKRWLTK